MRREYLWALVTLVIAIALAFILLNIAEKEAPSQAQHCADEETRERIRDLSFEAFDQAFKNHTMRLFDNWLLDPHDQPKRAQAGMQNGIRAYLRGRDLAMAWTIPPC
jgi:hypothetical protein